MQYYKVRKIHPWLYSIKEMGVFCYLLVGHCDEPKDKSVFHKYISVAKNADVEKSEPYAPFGERSDLKGWLYKENDIAIAFNPEKMLDA